MKNNHLKLTFVGDIFPANLGYNAGFGIVSKFLKHNGKVWESQVEEIFVDSEIVFGNLESPLLENKDFCDNNNFATSYLHISMILLKVCKI